MSRAKPDKLSAVCCGRDTVGPLAGANGKQPCSALNWAMQWYRFDELAAAQLYEMLAFRQAVFVVEQRSPYFDLDGRDQVAAHLLLRRDGELAGYLRLIHEAAAVRIGRVAVAPDRRRQGIGRILVEAALRRCREDFVALPVRLSAQTYLVPFYRSFGFAPVSEPYDDYGVPHVDMMKEG